MRAIAALAAVTLAVAAVACSDDGGGDSAATTAAPSTTTTSPASAGCGAAEVPEAGTTDNTMTSGGEERRYQLTIPEGYDGSTPLPLVFGLHALTVSYTFVSEGAGLGDMAEDYDFIAVMPSGLVDAGTPYWLAVPVEPNRDLEFIEALLDRLEDELCIDTSQVFSTGQSNGGQMSSLLACKMSDRITAVAPVAGVEFSDQCDGEPVPVMAFHGDADPIVTYEGGGLNATTIANQQFWKGDIPPGLPEHGGVDQALTTWAEHNGCDPDPVEEDVSDEVLRRTWQNCDAETVLYVIRGGGHTWPGRPVPGFDQFGPTTTDIDASALMFEFWLGPPDS